MDSMVNRAAETGRTIFDAGTHHAGAGKQPYRLRHVERLVTAAVFGIGTDRQLDGRGDSWFFSGAASRESAPA